MTNTLLKPTTMKKLKLILLLCICCQGLYAQNPLDLRGVRHYYSSPTLSFVGFKPLYVEEKNDFYYLSGFAGFMAATIVKIDKYTNTPLWNFCETNNTQSVGFTIDENDNVMMAYHINCGSPCYPDSLRTVQINPIGQTIYKKHATDLVRVRSFNRTNINENLATGHKDSSIYKGTSEAAYPYAYPSVFRFNNSGDLTDSIILPITNTFQNLPVERGWGVKTFNLDDKYITFGNITRKKNANIPIYEICPTYWLWNGDGCLESKEVFLDYPGHDTGMQFGEITAIDFANKEFAFPTTRSNGSFPISVYLTHLDSNLTISWDKKVGNLPSTYGYVPNDVKINCIDGSVYLVGQVLGYNIHDDLLFLSKYRKNGTIEYIKHFIIDESSANSIFAMSILEDGDLLFAGRGSNDGITSFFTYRTGPDGYDPAGQYLGLEVITASPTEIGIFPNPSDGVFQVSSLSEEQMLITLLDQQGKQVALFELNELSSNNSFDLSDQVPGVYYAHISQGENQWVKKLVVR
jgi:hypothetical protein